MNLIVQTVTIIYLFLMVPFHFGILETIIFKKSQKSVSEVLINGFLLMLAAFCVISVVAVKLQWALIDLTKIWIVFVMVVSVIASVLGFKQIKRFMTEMIGFWSLPKNDEGNTSKKRYQVLGILVVMLLISVLFTRPSYEDATLEIVNTAVATDRMYMHNPYNGLLSESAIEGHAYSPLEMLYAVGAVLTGIEVPYMLYYLVPICFLSYFYVGIWNLGNRLLEDREKVSAFVLIITGIYWMTTYLEGQSLVTGIFLNSWNGLTLLSCLVLPVVFGNLTEWMQEVQKSNRVFGLFEKSYRVMIFLLAALLTNAKGAFYVGLMLFVTLAVISVRKGYDYVVTSGRFKKRV